MEGHLTSPSFFYFKYTLLKLDQSLLMQFLKDCLNSQNNTSLAKTLNKRYALDVNDTILRKAIGVIQKVSSRDEIDSADLLTVTGQTIGKDGEVVSTKLGTRRNDIVDTDGLKVKSVTQTPFGGAYVKYENDKELDYNLIFDSLFSKYNDFKFPQIKPSSDKKSKTFSVLNIYDSHLDKSAIKTETGEDNNLETNIKRYKKAFHSLLNDLDKQKVSEIIFPIGNDLYHTNGMNGKTKKGTDLQYMCSPEEAYEAISDVMIECVSELLQVAKVHIPFIKGNHDEDKINLLGYWIPKLFSKNKHFEYNSSRRQRKYLKRGKVLLGFAHGDKEKRAINQLPLLMATEKPQLWASTRKKKMYCGDLHHKFEYKFLKSKDFPSCEVEFLRSIGCSDKYHSDYGWIGIPKSAEATIFNYEGTKEWNIREDF